MAVFECILAPTDFSEASRPALDLAIEMASDSEADLAVMHTCEIPAYFYPGMTMAPVDVVTPLADVAQAKLAELMASVRARHPSARSVLKVGIAWEEILAAAAESQADLIVMGTHGRRGFAHALLGSVAERVVRMSPVPVLTVRSRSKRPRG